MRRLLALIGLTLLVTAGLAAPAQARELVPRCVLVPDLDGHVWQVCH